MILNTEYESVLVSKLVPHPANPRKGDVSAVCESIKTNGFFGALVAQRSTSHVLAGNHRLLAARELGLESVPVVWVDVDDTTAKRILLADNKTADLATYDDALLAAILADLSAQDAVDGLGFSDDELVKLLGPPEMPAEVPDDIRLEGEAVSQRGGVYQLGPHRLVCGDCRSPEDVALLFDDELAAVAFTSPPYASQRKYDEDSEFEPIHPDEFVAWFERVQFNVAAHLEVGGSWFVNIKEHCDDGQRVLYVKDLVLAHVREWSWRFVDEFAWTKSGVPGAWNNRFKNGWEPVFHFSRTKAIKMRAENVMHASDDTVSYSPSNTKTHSGFISGSAGRESGMARPSNVLTIYNHPHQIDADEQVSHTATFPVDLPLFFVRAFTDIGDVVYDPFMGSGTTMMAAAQAGRRAFGCEISPVYCDLIRRRWGRYAESAGMADAGDAL